MQISLEPIVVVIICIDQYFNCVRGLSVIVVRLAVSAAVVFGNWSTGACQNRNKILNPNTSQILLELPALLKRSLPGTWDIRRWLSFYLKQTIRHHLYDSSAYTNGLKHDCLFPCKIWCSCVSPGCFCRSNLNLPTNNPTPRESRWETIQASLYLSGAQLDPKNSPWHWVFVFHGY